MKTYKELTQQIAEATKWKKGDGRPRGGSHIENIKFWDLPDASLKYIQKDASAAMKANPEGKKAGKYADEVNDAATVLFWRKKNKIVVESVELDEARNDTSKYTDDKLKAVLKQLKGLDQDAPSTKSMLKKVKKEIEKRGLSEQLEESAVSKLSPMAQFKLINDFLGIRQASGVKNFKTDPERAEKIIKIKKVSDKEVEDALVKMKKEKWFKEDTTDTLGEAKKLKASDIVKMMKDPEDWGSDGKDKVYTKGSNFVYIDSFHFTGDKALKNLVSEWSPKGSYYQYFKDEYGCDLKIVDSFIEPKATGKHKKLSKDGIVGVEIKVQ